MIRLCAIAGLALAVSVTAASGAPVPGKLTLKPNNLNVGKVKNQTGHTHLLQAEKDLEAAETAIAAQNLKQAHQDVAAAIRQVEDAIKHHHKHHGTPPGQSNGTNPTRKNAKHHHHHSKLKQVVAEMRVAEKELRAGAVAQASREIQKAETTLKSIIASHNQLPRN